MNAPIHEILKHHIEPTMQNHSPIVSHITVPAVDGWKKVIESSSGRVIGAFFPEIAAECAEKHNAFTNELQRAAEDDLGAMPVGDRWDGQG